MIITRLVGGLGNQLFQYAAARALSVFHQTELKLDITPFEIYKLHKYSLNVFSIQDVFASKEEIEEFQSRSKKGWNRFVFPVTKRLLPYYRQPVLKEETFAPFDPNFFKTSKDLLLDGYWQSAKYFLGIQDTIRREFVIKVGLDIQSQEIAKKITSVQSVSIHIRRGDYVSNPITNQFHGTSSLDYYARCISKIAQKISNPHFFVFSDDPSWAAQNLHLNYPATFVTHNDASRNYEDLRLMSMCKHTIIANSSFSWWGAWLNPNPEKLVFAPRQWFNDPKLDTKDLIPLGWEKL